MKILIVEDEEGLREALIRSLTGEGYLADGAAGIGSMDRTHVCSSGSVVMQGLGEGPVPCSFVAGIVRKCRRI